MLVLVLVAVFVGPRILVPVLGHNGDEPFPYATKVLTFQPVGPWSWVPDLNHEVPSNDDYTRVEPKHPHLTLLPAGADGPLGRDELLRLLQGGQVSLEVAFGATFLSIAIGAVLGLVSGWFGGWVDAAIGRLTDFIMAFPLLLFLIMVGSTSASHIGSWTIHGILQPGVLSLVLLIGGFTWFYPARILRSHVKRLVRQEFVEAALMVGGTRRWIMTRHLVPHLVPPMAVLATLLIPTNILLEAGVTFLGAGIRLPTPSWGNMLATTWGTLLSPQTISSGTSIWLTVLPSGAIFLCVLACNQFGEGLREALEPQAG